MNGEGQEATREGGCGCGSLRYRVTGEPICVNNCYCTLCQRQTGSTSVVNMFYEADRLELLSGETARHLFKGGSGADHAVVRCAACGTAMWSEYGRLGSEAAAIRVGTLDDSSGIRPDAAIFLADRMHWVTPPEGTPQFDGYYNAAELLPPDRFARLKAVAAKASRS